MPRKQNPDPKTLALRQQGCLNPHPEQVTDELFQAREVFDPRDVVQVKYEMLRRVETEGLPVSRSAASIDLSSPRADDRARRVQFRSLQTSRGISARLTGLYRSTGESGLLG